MRRFCDDVLEHIIPFFFQLMEKREGFISDLERDYLDRIPYTFTCYHTYYSLTKKRVIIIVVVVSASERERDALR